MSKKIGRLLICMLLFVSASSLAEQGCPDGFIPNAAGTPGVPCVAGQSNDWSVQKKPTSRWVKRWGAFTSDSVTSKVGVASGASSKGKAEREAVADCKRRGGSRCEVLLSFVNQCGAIAWGERPGASGVLSAVSAASEEQAKEDALRQCSLKSKSCEIFLSECSFAELVR